MVGRLTKDPELNFLPNSGTAIAKFIIAVNRPHLDKSKSQEADFIPCVCFGKRAEAIVNYAQKGHLFGLSGRLQINKYVDKDGNNRWSTDVFVEDFEFLQTKNNSDKQGTYIAPDYEGDLTPIDDGDIPF